eukprot:791589-Amphidinium_carterae.1
MYATAMSACKRSGDWSTCLALLRRMEDLWGIAAWQLFPKCYLPWRRGITEPTMNALIIALVVAKLLGSLPPRLAMH